MTADLPLCAGTERRRSQRLGARLRVDYCALVRHGDALKIGPPQRACTVDLSASGLFLTEVAYLPLGATIHVFLRLPDVPANPVACFARVVRSQASGPCGYAVRFVRLRLADALRIESYVRAIEAHREREPLRAARTVELGEEDIVETTPVTPLSRQRTIELGEGDIEVSAGLARGRTAA